MKKICSKCRRELPLSEFYPQKAGKYGVSSICKSCTEDSIKLKRLENKIRKIINNIIDKRTRPINYREELDIYREELDDANIEFKPHLKENFTYTVIVSQVQDCWITVEAKSREEAVFKAYSALYGDGVYMEDEVVFGKNAKLESVELDECPYDEDYVDIKYKEDEE